MSRRIDVELTSARDDGTWTWRAAGAKQPKGVVEADLLYPGAKVGDVVRAEADFEIDGITIVSVTPPKGEVRKEPERIEIIGTGRDAPGVTSSLVPKSGRDRDRGDRGDRSPRGDRPPRADRPPRGDRPARADGPPRGDRPPRTDRPGRPDRPERRPRVEERPAPPKAKRLSPANVHRAAVLEALAPEQRPIAEQVLRGGIPAVRQAVEVQNAERKQKGEPEVKAEPLLAMAEELLPRLKAAEWRDRAEAAVKDMDEISLRDLRSVVAGADAVARDDESRLLASSLREAFERRVNKQREDWVAEIGSALDEGRLVRALRLSSRPPDPGSRFPAELAAKLAEAAGAALTPDITPDRWATVLDAVASSPVRRTVKPVGLPAEPGDALLQAAKQASGRVPALAAMLGIDMPPPPGPARGARPPRPPARPGSGGPGSGGPGAGGPRGAVSRSGRPVPPPPPPGARPHAPSAPAPAPAAAATPTAAVEATAPVAPVRSSTAAAPIEAAPALTAAAPAPVEAAPAPSAPTAAAPAPPVAPLPEAAAPPAPEAAPALVEAKAPAPSVSAQGPAPEVVAASADPVPPTPESAAPTSANANPSAETEPQSPSEPGPAPEAQAPAPPPAPDPAEAPEPPAESAVVAHQPADGSV
jgi:hypothetical protein